MKSYKRKLKENNYNELSYKEKLDTIEWKKKRNFIVERDNNCCTKCKRKKTKNLFGKGIYYAPFIQKKTKSEEKIIEGFENVPREKYAVYFGKPIYLHVHHKYYITDKLPWEYSNDALTTLCGECHQEEHNNNKISVYLDERMINEMELTPCYRCSGSGYLEQYHYYMDGICFRCNGNKYEELIN